MRGELLSVLTNTAAEEKVVRAKGRNTGLVCRRDKCLLARYYYYIHLQKMKFADMTNRLSSEFFLTSDRIVRILQDNMEAITRMKDQKTRLSTLRREWPHLKW